MYYPGNGLGFKKLDRSKTQGKKLREKQEGEQEKADAEEFIAGFTRKDFKRLMKKEFAKREPKMFESLLNKEVYKAELNPQDTPVCGCKGCGEMLLAGATRFKCCVCDDFDFCAKCEATKEHPHPFLKLDKPEHKALEMIALVYDKEKDKKQGKQPAEGQDALQGLHMVFDKQAFKRDQKRSKSARKE